jgi:hypothetical protein
MVEINTSHMDNYPASLNLLQEEVTHCTFDDDGDLWDNLQTLKNPALQEKN